MEADKVTHQLNPGATFENALSLYQFDAKLRELIFDAIQKIEISLRSKMIHEFSLIKTTTYNRNAIRREFIDRKFIFYIMCTCISL